MLLFAVAIAGKTEKSNCTGPEKVKGLAAYGMPILCWMILPLPFRIIFDKVLWFNIVFGPISRSKSFKCNSPFRMVSSLIIRRPDSSSTFFAEASTRFSMLWLLALMNALLSESRMSFPLPVMFDSICRFETVIAADSPILTEAYMWTVK